ncbi:cytochrome c oxidase subunit IV-domain-containing protein [Ephemerocybe angulata]|uniref:Cytochrome c oxidase subunit IV-domain-containing protein n=1 Tax=Ephemerocybe angulata TaxID=980116 RepID=A0A8H6HB55_9AGAR|nr:cytochrome c oxidase subunit IV-domain-containing protein [Tulosesus angulatus]
MQAALRLAARQRLSTTTIAASRRCLATAAASHAELARHAGSGAGAAATRGRAAPVSLANIEAQWNGLSAEEQAAVHDALESVQAKDWKELSVDEKKAAYYVAFGPHGSRAPISHPGDSLKLWASVAGLVAAAGLLAIGVRQFANGPAPTMTKEWQEATNERALEMKLDPITGLASEGYKGKGFVQSE